MPDLDPSTPTPVTMCSAEGGSMPDLDPSTPTSVTMCSAEGRSRRSSHTLARPMSAWGVVRGMVGVSRRKGGGDGGRQLAMPRVDIWQALPIRACMY